MVRKPSELEEEYMARMGYESKRRLKRSREKSTGNLQKLTNRD